MEDDANFFAIVVSEHGERELRRIRVDRGLQEELSIELAAQADDFLQESERVPYEPLYHPDEGELLEISPYQLPPYFQALQGELQGVPNVLEREMADIRAVFAYAQGRYLFQYLDARYVLQRGRKYLFLSGDTFSQDDRVGLTLRKELAAIYENGSLLFRSENLVRRFLELDSYFKAATDEEIRGFVSHSLWADCDEHQVIALSDQWTRKKIASIGRRGVLDAVDVAGLKATAQHFDIDVATREQNGEEVLEVPTERREMKTLLKLLNEDYVESRLTETRFDAPSKRTLGRKA